MKVLSLSIEQLYMATHEQAMREAQRASRECAETCMRTVRHCLTEGGEHAATEHITMLLDCADICQLSNAAMARESRHHGDICTLCATICEDCATDCESFENDEKMAECAASCRSCAAACREMVAAA